MTETSTEAAATEASSLDELRAAFSQLLGAERRLRGRDHAPGELSHAHIRSLHALEQQGEMTAGQLARSAELNPASVTAMLDHLEQAGIVARSRSTVDRRVTNVALTPHGRAVLAQRTARWRARWSEALAPFSAQELEVGTRVVREIAVLLDAITAEQLRTPDRLP